MVDSIILVASGQSDPESRTNPMSRRCKRRRSSNGLQALESPDGVERGGGAASERAGTSPWAEASRDF
jgi:hypothetical protein